MLTNRSSLRADLSEHIASRIVRGELSPGVPLNLAELAATLEVSVTPVREALIELERDGLVHSILNRGYFVRPIDPAEAYEIYPVVAALEVLAVESTPISRDRTRELRAINRRMRDASSPARRIELDNEWHSALVADCRNGTLLAILATVKRRLFRYEYAFMSNKTLSGRSFQQHEEIVLALAAGRRARAAQLLRENWTFAPAEEAEERNALRTVPRRHGAVPKVRQR